MAKFDCSFCKEKIFFREIKDLPSGWGLIISQQGKCTLEFRYCPEHEQYRNLQLWDLISREKSTAATRKDPNPF